MNQSDFKALANQFMRNTLCVQPGDNIWIEYVGPKAQRLAEACKTEVQIADARPFMVDSGSAALNKKITGLSEKAIKAYGKKMLGQMKPMQGYIRITDDADAAKMTMTESTRQQYKIAMNPMIKYRVENTRWLVVNAPTEEFAANCGMTSRKFRAFYLNACLLDYSPMTEAVKPLQKLMAEGKSVRIFSPAQQTDLSFSIEGIGAESCTGKMNIPDGECFTAPVIGSANGVIRFGKSCYEGKFFDSIKLEIQQGFIVAAEVENNPKQTETLNAILDTDAGARYLGEFAINFNPWVKNPTGSILFDEKIDGGIHIAVGNSYEETDNGNKSAIHWDMVHIQRPEFGGGELWIDDRLIRKDGRFVVPELLALNPENLILRRAPKPFALMQSKKAASPANV